MNFNSHFKDLFENTSDLIHFVGIEGEIQTVNTSWLQTLHYELYEVVGRSVYEFIHPDYIEKFKVYRELMIKDKQPIFLQTAYITKSGHTVNVEGQILASYQQDRPLYTRGVFKNITSKNISDKKLKESEIRFNTLFKRAPDAIIVINEHQNILEWNPKAETIFGYMAEEVLGERLSETIIPVQYREAHKKGMAHFLKTGEGPVLNKTIEITAVHKNGKEFFVNLSISNVRLENEWLFIAFLSDISERKKTEEALIYKEAELLQSKYLEDKKDEFISIASHELKSPLTTIKAYTQIALTCCDKTPEKVYEYLLKVDKYTDNLHGLINEMLDVSKIQAGKLLLSTSLVDLSSFLKEALNSIQHITADHQIIIEENVSAKVNIDPLRIEQVVTNIISNAAKYSPGKHKIVVSSQITNGMVVVSFKDFGIGIPQQNLDKVFTRFYRVNENAVQFSGLGIGLFISAEIIKQHGGKIWAESLEGEGSTFHFGLPLES